MQKLKECINSGGFISESEPTTLIDVLEAPLIISNEVRFDNPNNDESIAETSTFQVIYKTGNTHSLIPIEELKKIISNWEPNITEQDESFAYYMVLLSGVWINHTTEELHEYTGISKETVDKIILEATNHQIFVDNTVCCEWFCENFNINFEGWISITLDILLCKGQVERTTKDGKTIYKPDNKQIVKEMKNANKPNLPMKNTLEDLRNHLFEVLERLNDDDCDVENETKRAAAVIEVAKSVVETGRLECEFVRLSEGLKGEVPRTGFFPKSELKKLGE